MADDQKPQESVVFATFKGLRNTLTEERLAPDELARAVNVDLDDGGQLHRRRGFTRKAVGRFHSLTNTAWGLLGVKDGVLSLINPDYTTTPILDVGTDPLAYVEVGPDVYFASRSKSGRIHADLSLHEWGAEVSAGTWVSPVVNPTTTLGAVAGRLFGKPPFAEYLEYYNGRIYLANGTLLWATELYLYDYVDKTKNFIQFETPITGIGAVTDGIYVGTEDAVYFLGGQFREFRRVPTTQAGMIPRSMISVPNDLVVIPQQQTSKNAVLFLTALGLCVGTDGGNVFSLTQDRVVLPRADSSAVMFRRQDGVNQYVGVLHTVGTPSTSARFGDHVDAEIRRFKS